MGDPALVLAVNSGSSSVKLALLDPLTGARSLTALADRLGSGQAQVVVRRGSDQVALDAGTGTHVDALAGLVEAMTGPERGSIAAVGHRVVHGGEIYSDPVLVDQRARLALDAVTPLAPLHLPGNLAGIDAVAAALPEVPAVAVFDTAFHRTLPEVAWRYAVPRAWHDEHGVRRYGFHGISHEYVARVAAELLGRPVEETRMVTLHLGNGCSATAVRDGRSVDTTMGFTPLEGLVMGTRSGDVDPGALAHVARATGAGWDEMLHVLNTESGLLGVSGLSNDMRTLVDAAARGDESADLAVELFAYRVAKAVAALAVPLGRLDAVVLTGGIGEHSVEVRSRVMAHLAVLGVRPDPDANTQHGRKTLGRISAQNGVPVLVVPTDEELVIARAAAALVADR